MAKITTRWKKDIPKEWRVQKELLPVHEFNTGTHPWSHAVKAARYMPTIGRSDNVLSIDEVAKAPFVYIYHEDAKILLPAVAIPVAFHLERYGIILCYSVGTGKPGAPTPPNGCSLFRDGIYLPPYKKDEITWCEWYDPLYSYYIEEIRDGHLADGWRIVLPSQVEQWGMPGERLTFLMTEITKSKQSTETYTLPF